MKKQIVSQIACTILGLLGAACTCPQTTPESRPISSDARARPRFEKYVNCDTAAGDIAALQDERVSLKQRIMIGGRMTYPGKSAAQILGQPYSTEAAVPTDKYNDDLNARIGEISMTCGL